MDNGDISTQNPEGPYCSHLYIGCSQANWKTVLRLRAQLEQRGVICNLRATSGRIERSIQEGVGTSQKCLLFLTSDYVKDAWYNLETSEVIEKSQRFSREVVIILKSDDLKVIPEMLQKFKVYQFKPEKVNDEKFLAPFVDTQEPIMNLTVAATKRIPGYESARNYFYGFLQMVLPNFKAELLATLKNDPDLVPKTLHKMLIIMPESCCCETKLDLPNQIEFANKYIVRVIHRAGNNKRDYKSSLYKVIDEKKHQEFYFVGEFATPLVTMYESYKHGLSGTTMDELYEERDGFYHTLKAILSHPDNADCNNQFKLLYWSDPETKKLNQLDIYRFLLPALEKEISLQRQRENDPKNNDVHLFSQNRPSLKTYEPVPFDGSNPAGLFESVSKYPMNRRPRGLCLIINMVKFDNRNDRIVDLEYRSGAERDKELLEKLFTDLHFNVKVHVDVSEQTLRSLCEEMQTTNHSDYDAFVCCIMTHGKHGVIYTRDGKPVKILSIVEYFTDINCPSLKGKPKMFFIQACQKGDESEIGAARDIVPHGSSTGVRLALQSSQNTASNRETVTNIQATDSIQGEISIDAQKVEPEISADAMPTCPETLPIRAITPMQRTDLVPGSPDFLMSYSTLPGSVSYRDPQAGSFYVQALNDCLRKDMEIDRALKTVSSSVKEMIEACGHGQITKGLQLPFHVTSGMYQTIYL